MSTSSAVVSTPNMELTPMRVSFKGPGAGSFVDLGGTLGNVKVMVEFKKAEIHADQSGKTVRDRRVSALNISVETELAQIRDKNIWKTVFPHGQLVTDGITGHQMIYFVNQIGDSDLANSGQLKLHPLSLLDSDLSGDYLFYLACADAKSEVVYGPEEQTKLKVIWNILPDATTNPERFMIHGDATIGIVHALAGAPSFAGTGNGTLTGVAVSDSATKTETITVTNVSAHANGGIFSVVGSVSGELGVAVLPNTAGGSVIFSSREISFTLTDGGTDFALNDAFTIATTSANYV